MKIVGSFEAYNHRWVRTDTGQWIDMSKNHEKLNDLFELVKAQFQSGSISLEVYEQALKIISS